MGKIMKKVLLSMFCLTGLFLFSMTALAATGSEVRDFPGWNGSGTKTSGPASESDTFDLWDDDDDYVCERGWRYSPAGWWFQYSDGSWPANCWKYLDGRWYRFDQGGHIIIGWFTDTDGFKYYLNPVDDGTLGSLRIGWQLIDGKAYYFNTMSDGYLGRLLTDQTTPDGYKVGADGAWIS